MAKKRHFFSIRILIFVLIGSISAIAQTLVATVPVQDTPRGVAVDPGLNKIYVVNNCGNDPQCNGPGTVTVIDGSTLSTQNVTVGYRPYYAEVDPVSHKIFVSNSCGSDPTCNSLGTVTVIDGSTLSTHTVAAGASTGPMAVNSNTGKIYVVNFCGNDPTCTNFAGTATVINEATLTTQTVTVGSDPADVSVNPVTNKAYVANFCGSHTTCLLPYTGTMTVIDGATLTTQTVDVGTAPGSVAVNSLTNKIYIVNSCGNDPTCTNLSGTVSVIDGATLNTQAVNVGSSPYEAAVNSVTGKVYVANYCGNDPTCTQFSGTVTVINGTTLSTQTVTVGQRPSHVKIDSVTNEAYVTNQCGNDPACASPGSVSIIDGGTGSVASITVGRRPSAIALNELTNRIYVTNFIDNTVSVIAGANAAALQFVPITPCRLVDTRNGNPIQGGASQNFTIPQLGGCGIPTTAAAYSLNVTVVPHTTLGYLSIWPTGENQPVVSTMNSPDGRVKANAAIVPAGYQGAVSVYVTDTTDVILDINGYFTSPGSGTLQFYNLTPCRIVDTRNNMHGGTLHAGVERDYTIPTNCGVPRSAQAYSFNITVIPPSGGLDYLTVWPKGEMRPVVSTLNDNTGSIVANAAIVPAGPDNATAFYAHNNRTDLLIDVNGYFAPAGTGGLSLYPVAPCRVLDTRGVGSGQPFTGDWNPPNGVDVLTSPCAPPSTSKAFVFNATVVPPGSLPYLTLWPHGENQPNVSTLNATDGAITSNMAIVPTNDGSIDAYAAGLTQLILDISGYFAP